MTPTKQRYRGYDYEWSGYEWEVSLAIHGNSQVVFRTTDMYAVIAWIDNQTRQSLQMALVSYQGY